MESLFVEIRKALEAELWTLALNGALVLPDICGALASPDGIARGVHYKAWFEEYMGADYPMLDPQDCWELRCGLLHQGRAATGNYDRILFTAPPMVMHNNRLNNGLNIDIGIFCDDLVNAAERWYHVSRAIEPVKSNADLLMRWHPNGYSPYIEGYPVLT